MCPERKPDVPDSKNKLQLIRKKFDYVTAAIAETRHPDRSKPQAIADSHKGHKYFPENSGLFPQYVNKKVIILYLECLNTQEEAVWVNICSDVCRTMEKSPRTCKSAQRKSGTTWRNTAASCKKRRKRRLRRGCRSNRTPCWYGNTASKAANAQKLLCLVPVDADAFLMSPAGFKENLVSDRQ